MAPMPALTRASTIGPLADALRARGGSADRLFRQADLPLGIIDAPQTLVPLNRQTRLVEMATVEVGDPALPLRLAAAAGVSGLGPYAPRILGAPSLGEAISVGNGLTAAILQSATVTRLRVAGAEARWSYRVDTAIEAGRSTNERLAVGYIMALVRRFAGPDWTPSRIELPDTSERGAIEAALGCDLVLGPEAAVVFPADLLTVAPPATRFGGTGGGTDDLPAPEDLPRHVRTLIDLALLDGRPKRNRITGWLELPTRTMQRRLADAGTTFAAIVRAALLDRALDLRGRGASVTATAYELGYTDVAHFSRAFAGWTGRPPTARSTSGSVRARRIRRPPDAP